MKEWNKLSMAEKADIMKLAIQGGVYDLDAIRNGYNKFAEGGDQETLDTIKQNDHDFNVKDWAWRLKKLRPDTDVDVEDTDFFYNYVPVTAVTGTSDNWGTFEHHGDSGEINVWADMIPDSQYGGIHSKDSRLSRTISHETNHNYVHNLLEDNHTKQEEDLLMQAYPDEIFNFPENPINERRATNMELRKQISQWDNNSTMEDLDKAIDRIHPTQLMDMYFRTSGYTQDPTKQNRKYMQLPNGNWDRKKIDLMKRALKDVASNQVAMPDTNYAANGGKIHIKHPGRLTALKKRTGKTEAELYNDGNPAHKKMVVFARNARKWKHAYGGELGNYYDGWGDAWNYLKRGVKKARQKVKDWGLDKDPIQHLASKVEDKYSTIIQNRNPELSGWINAALDAGRVLGINNTIKGEDDDIRYKQNLYNLIDPTNAIPESVGDAIDYAKAIKAAKSDKDYSYSRMYEDKAADAAWAKRLGLPYDTTILVDNPDGSVHLAKYLEDEIPTDTNFIKKRIADNEELMNKTYGPKRRDIRAALDVDNKALEALRETYRTGNKVEMNEFSHMSRDLRQNNQTSPLNLLHRYTLQYDKDNNVMNYSDIYNFDGFEDYVPGNPFDIRGRIELGKRTRK